MKLLFPDSRSANQCRRYLIQESGSAAIDTCVVTHNTSSLGTEILIHRLGFLVVKVDRPTVFDKPILLDVENASNEVMWVTSDDLNSPYPMAATSTPICLLYPGQRVEMECYLAWSNGADHAKFTAR